MYLGRGHECFVRRRRVLGRGLRREGFDGATRLGGDRGLEASDNVERVVRDADNPRHVVLIRVYVPRASVVGVRRVSPDVRPAGGVNAASLVVAEALGGPKSANASAASAAAPAAPAVVAAAVAPPSSGPRVLQNICLREVQVSYRGMRWWYPEDALAVVVPFEGESCPVRDHT